MENEAGSHVHGDSIAKILLGSPCMQNIALPLSYTSKDTSSVKRFAAELVKLGAKVRLIAGGLGIWGNKVERTSGCKHH